MCEVLIRVYDKVNAGDAVLDRQASKAGDIIAVQPDDWGWTAKELANPDWRVVKLPGIDPATWADMLEPDVLTVDNGDGTTRDILVRRRKKWIDIVAYPAVLTYLRSNTSPITPNTPNRNAVNTARLAKAVINVIEVG